MARWEPGARERLHAAAVELFADRGYAATTAAEIAERAGLAKSSFFRHFTDKREVLFFGQEMLNDHLADAIAQAPPGATPLEAIGAALDALAVAFPDERRSGLRDRQRLIDDHAELRERELLKRMAMTAALAAALRRRGVPETTACLAAQVGDVALSLGYRRWLDPAAGGDFSASVRQALDELRTASRRL